METKTHNREWVKTAAIIFLCVLLVLTFFSNTIMNRSLPEVATSMVDSGTITARVRGTGTVKSNGEYQVIAGSTRKIQSVMVKKGDDVEAGDVLFVLGDGDSEELKAAVEELYQLQLSYRRSSVSASSYDYTLQQMEIDKAQAAVDTCTQNVADTKKELDDAGTALAQAEANQGGATQAEQDAIKAAKEKLGSAQTNMDAVQTEYDEAVDEALQAKADALNAYSAFLENNPVPTDETEKAKYDEDLLKLKNEVTRTETNYQALVDFENGTVPATVTDDKDVLALQSKLTAAKDSLAAATSEYNRLTGQLSDDYANALAAYAEADAAYTAAQQELSDANDTLTTLQYNLNQQKISDGKSSALTGLELQDLKRQIDAQQAVVDSLSGDGSNTITAPVAGTITEMDITAGQTTQKDGVLCIIEVADMGYTLSFSVTNDQAKRLKVGDTATVSNYYWGTSVTATLTTIATDPQNSRTNKLLTFDVEGDVSEGSELTISVGSKSATYDTIIPKSAIRTDSNGSFVLVIQAKNNALGNRYFAKRVSVETVAEDDINCAVTGDLETGDFVITTSSAPISGGDQVRMADS